MDRNRVEDVLFAMGIPANIKGFGYIADALDVMDKKGCNASITKIIYPEVAKKNHATPSRVERAIRHAFEIANSERGDYEVFEKYIGHINTNNGAALASLYKRIKMEEDEKKAETMKQIPDISPELDSVIRKIVWEELRRIAAN